MNLESCELKLPRENLEGNISGVINQINELFQAMISHYKVLQNPKFKKNDDVKFEV